jgi:hypothetical protein
LRSPAPAAAAAAAVDAEGSLREAARVTAPVLVGDDVRASPEDSPGCCCCCCCLLLAARVTAVGDAVRARPGDPSGSCCCCCCWLPGVRTDGSRDCMRLVFAGLRTGVPFDGLAVVMYFGSVESSSFCRAAAAPEVWRYISAMISFVSSSSGASAEGSLASEGGW